MANPEHVEAVRQGAEAIQALYKAMQKKVLDLSDADLRSFDLEGADLFNADLTGADLSEAGLEGAKLCGATLQAATLRYADLTGADLTIASLLQADLTGSNLSATEMHGTMASFANFSGTDLSQADMLGARCSFSDFSKSILIGTSFVDSVLRNANFDQSVLRNTVFAGCDMSEARNLARVTHKGHSSLGIDTLLLSRGQFPPEFLRGCGLPDRIIDFVKSIAQKPIKFYSCFISHSSLDEPFPKHLLDKLQGAGLCCWYFPETARTGEKLWDEIDRAIRIHDKLVVICSCNSLSSEPVIKEIQRAFQLEKEEVFRRHADEERVVRGEITQDDFAHNIYHTRILFPIAIDDYLFDHWMHPLKHELKNRVVADFRGWEKDSKTLDTMFQKLLKNLIAE